MEFKDWLQKELDKREWRATDLARIGNIDNGLISRILSGAREPSVKTLEKIADAFRVPLARIYQEAGLLPPDPQDAWVKETTHKLQHIKSEDLRELVTEMIEMFAEREKKSRK